MPPQPPRLLLVGLGDGATGFGRVLRALIRELAGSYRVAHLALDLPELALRAPDLGGADGPSGVGWAPHTVLPNPPSEGRVDPLGRRALARAVDGLRPELVLLVHEAWAWSRWLPVLTACSHRPRTVLYAAIDHDDAVDIALARDLAALDRLVAYGAYGRGVLERAFAAADVPSPPWTEIAHGVDLETFRPLATHADGSPDRAQSRQIARRRLRGLLRPLPAEGESWNDRPIDLDEAFLVLNANRNQPTKRIDLSVEGFERFLRSDRTSGSAEHAWLVLHMANARRRPGEITLVDRLGIRDRVLTTLEPSTDGGATRETGHPHFDDAKLNLLYNACNVGLNTSEGEGWGLVSLEHGAVGAPQVVPDHSACAELWQGHALLLDTETESAGEGYRQAGRTVTATSVADALGRLHADAALRHRLGAAAVAVARRPAYRWPAIGAQWRRLLAELL
ncbi:MAG: glycosyltransferase [Acidobacteriota bacterium]